MFLYSSALFTGSTAHFSQRREEEGENLPFSFADADDVVKKGDKTDWDCFALAENRKCSC